jgi:hypothetical protein
LIHRYFVVKNNTGYHILDSYILTERKTVCSFISKRKSEIICNILNDPSIEENNVSDRKIVYTIAEKDGKKFVIAVSDVEKGVRFQIKNNIIFGNRICVFYKDEDGEKIINLLNNKSKINSLKGM